MTDKDLLNLAKETYKNAYSPYSKVKVGAALLTKDNLVFTGCNIENASYGLTICAERSALASAVSNGKKHFSKIAIASNQKREFSPCGACRQTLAEFNPKLKVIWNDKNGKTKKASLSKLLPFIFKK